MDTSRVSPIVALPYAPGIFYGSLAAIYFLDRRRAGKPTREGEVERDEGTGPLIRRLGLAAIVLAIAAAYSVPAATLPVAPVVGFATGLTVQWAGYALVEWTTRILGTLYRPVVAVQRDHRVVRRGPYRLVRHPMYAAALLSDIGTGLALANWVSLAVLLGVSSAVYLRRISVEERLLCELLGDEYRDYARVTKRLIPFIW